MIDVLVIGAGPAGVVAALRAADAGAKTTLVTQDRFGGMAATDGPVPVRTLAHAARLIRDAGQLCSYGIVVGKPSLDFPRLLARVREVLAKSRRTRLFAARSTRSACQFTKGPAARDSSIGTQLKPRVGCG
jgi:pyruvate/2-oxoglutarate dehydrogenase complex dihydrolipoamide dehydrogenase (E3) component